MAQHFLLSTKTRTLSLAKVLRLSDTEAYEAFKAVRLGAVAAEVFGTILPNTASETVAIAGPSL